MTAITFDTLKYANTLEAAGFPRAQAEAQAEALSGVLEVNLKELATKGDLLALQRATQGNFTLLKQEIDAKLIQLEQRMTIKLGALMVIAVGVVAAIVKL